MNAKQLVEAVSPEARHNNQIMGNVKRLLGSIKRDAAELEKLIPDTGLEDAIDIVLSDLEQKIKEKMLPRKEATMLSGPHPSIKALVKAINSRSKGWSYDSLGADGFLTEIALEILGDNDLKVPQDNIEVYSISRDQDDRSEVADITVATVPGMYVLVRSASDKVDMPHELVTADIGEIMAELTKVWSH